MLLRIGALHFPKIEPLKVAPLLSVVKRQSGIVFRPWLLRSLIRKFLLGVRVS